jgi:hypothetical protein
VWIDPVTAQVMIAFRCFAAIVTFSRSASARLQCEAEAAKRRGEGYISGNDIR